MPKLQGVYEYRFVEVGFRSDGRPWWPIYSPEADNVERLKAMTAASLEALATLCSSVGHDRAAVTARLGFSAAPCAGKAAGGGVAQCLARAQRARVQTKTADRPLCIKIATDDDPMSRPPPGPRRVGEPEEEDGA